MSMILRHNRPRLFVLSFLIVILCGSVSWYFFNHRYVAGKITFQEYAPKYLPQGVTVASRSIDAVYNPAERPAHFTMFNTQLSNGFVYLKENTPDITSHCAAGSIKNETCASGSTRRGQHYMLITTNGGQEVDQSVQFLKGNTNIMIKLTSKAGKLYTQSELERIIDSFTPVHYNDAPVHYISNNRI